MNLRLWAKAALAAAGASLFVSSVTPHATHAAERIDGDESAAATTGRHLYTAHCAECHGPAGKGDGRAAADFRKRPADLTDSCYADESDAELARALLKPHKPMPSFESTLTGDERRQIVAYLRTLSTPARNEGHGP